MILVTYYFIVVESVPSSINKSNLVRNSRAESRQNGDGIQTSINTRNSGDSTGTRLTAKLSTGRRQKILGWNFSELSDSFEIRVFLFFIFFLLPQQHSGRLNLSVRSSDVEIESSII